MKANGLRPRMSEEVQAHVAPTGPAVPNQLAIDEKMAGLKAQALTAKFGSQSLPPKTFIRGHEAKKWIQKHKFDEIRMDRDVNHRMNEEVNRKNIEFAKDLFISWDDDGSGELEAEEIIKPLINMGLAPNSEFATKLLHALDPNTKGKRNISDLRLNLQDFIKIFRSSKVSESLYNLIYKESEKRLKGGNLQPVHVSEMPAKRFDHPNARAMVDDSEEVDSNLDEESYRHKKISISMKAEREKAIVEFPIESAREKKRKGPPSKLSQAKGKAQAL